MGNVLAVITDGKLWNDSLNGYLAEVVSATDYEPFGLALDGRSLTGGGYRWGFNGKEDDGDFSFGIQDYGFRLYSRKLAKFLSVDPLFRGYPELTVYQFASNSPISGIDLDGLEYFYAADGTYIGRYGKSTEVIVVKGQDVKSISTALTSVVQTENRPKAIEFCASCTNLNVLHSEFAISSNIVKKEGHNEDDESLWIAHTANNEAKHRDITLYSLLMTKFSSVPKDEKTPLSPTDNSASAKAARAAIIDVLTGGEDPTGGARRWDGTDYLAWGLHSPNGTPHNKFEEYSYIYIPQGLFDQYLDNNMHKWGYSTKYEGTVYKLPSEVFNMLDYPENWGFYSGSSAPATSSFGFSYTTGYRGDELNATGVQGRTIFWKIDKVHNKNQPIKKQSKRGYGKFTGENQD